MLKGTFEAGFTHYDDPPPDVIDDLEAMRAAGGSASPTTSRRGSRSRTGAIVDAGYSGGGLMGSTTVRLAKLRTHLRAGRRSPTSSHDPEISRHRGARSCRPPVGAPACPAPRRVKHPPFVQFQAPDGVDDARAHDPRRRHVRASRCSARASSPATGSTTPTGKLAAKVGLANFKDWYRDAFGKHTPWGDQRLEGARHRGRDRARAPALGHDHAGGAQARDPHRQEGASASSSRATRATRLFLAPRRRARRCSSTAKPVAEVGPGAILGERAVLEGGIRTATPRRRRPTCGSRWRRPDQIDRDALLELAGAPSPARRDEEVTSPRCGSPPGTSTR